MKHILVPLILALALASSAGAWTSLTEVPISVGAGGSAVYARGYVWTVVGAGEDSMYPYDVTNAAWKQDVPEIPEFIDDASALAYERDWGSRLFLGDPDDGELLEFDFFDPPGAATYTGYWNETEIDLPEDCGPGIALAFRPVTTSPALISGYLYLLVGHPDDGNASSHVWRMVFPQRPWALAGCYAPDSNGYANTTDVLLDWNVLTEATQYQVQLSTSASFASTLLDTTLAANACHVSSSKFGGAATTYYWRVRFHHGSNAWSAWSNVWPFHKTTTAVTRSPHWDPPDSSVLTSRYPKFDWTWTTGANLFELQLDDDSSFGSPAADTQVSANEYVARDSLVAGTYYWRTKYRVGANWSSWSSKHYFLDQPDWVQETDMPTTVDGGGALCYGKRSGNTADSLWALVGGGSKSFYDYYLGSSSWTSVAPTVSPQHFGASLVTGGYDREIWENSGATGPAVTDSWLRRYLLYDNTWHKMDYLPSWTSPSQCTSYCATGSALSYNYTGAGRDNLYLTTAGDQRPDFWVLSVTVDEDGGGQTAGRTPVSAPPSVIYTPEGFEVKFSTNSAGPISARIYDAAGRLVKRLEMLDGSPGEHVLRWDRTSRSGEKVPSGAYFWTIAQRSAQFHLKVVVR
jgi:hypothetical protein